MKIWGVTIQGLMAATVICGVALIAISTVKAVVIDPAQGYLSPGLPNYMAVPTNAPGIGTFFKYDGTNISWSVPPTNTGPTGATGAQGVAGTNGNNGSAGSNGTNGIQGIIGLTGTTGATGSNGSTGSTGSAGSSGTNGIQGIAGINGTNGITGATGSAGSNGTNATTTATATGTATGLAPSYTLPTIVNLSSSGRSLVTSGNGFQISSIVQSHVTYTVSVSTTATIGGASSGNVALQVSPTISGSYVTVNSIGNSQTITLAVALSSVQVTTGCVEADVPAAYYVRLLSSGTGTFTNSFLGGCEKIDAEGY